jgi:hypothetical protein
VHGNIRPIAIQRGAAQPILPIRASRERRSTRQSFRQSESHASPDFVPALCRGDPQDKKKKPGYKARQV